MRRSRTPLKTWCAGAALAAALAGADCAALPPAGARTLAAEEYLDRVRGWWMGKMAGVWLGQPYEFTMPWPPREVRYYAADTTAPGCFPDNDDLYVALVFLLALEKHGPGVTREQIAAEFAGRLERERLWAANRRALLNLEAGVAPPLTGHPVFNEWYWAIDAQIQNDVWGVVCPGMPGTACALAERASRITNFADGACGGVFAAALASGAFFETDVTRLITAALGAIPAESDYAAAVRDVLAWHRQDPAEWMPTREKIRARWHDEKGKRDVSAVLNGAAVAMALLYGGGDFETTVSIAVMAGWDCDCTAATAGGIVGIMRGSGAVPARWDVFRGRYQNRSIRGLPARIGISELIGRTAAAGERMILARGGRREGGSYRLPAETLPAPGPPERAEPSTPAERERWDALRREKLALDLRLWNPGLALRGCRADGTTGLADGVLGAAHAFATAPADPGEPCVLAFERVPPAGAREEVLLELSASSGGDPPNRWGLCIAVDGAPVKTLAVSGEIPPEYRVPSLVPRRDEDIVLYVAGDGSTYHDRELTRLAQPSESHDPGARPAPLCVGAADQNVNLFTYAGGTAVDRPAYCIIATWADSPFQLISLEVDAQSPWGRTVVGARTPSLPPPRPRPVRLTLAAEADLPSVPEGGKYALLHDGNRASLISLPRVAERPSPWFRVRADLTKLLKAPARVELRQTAASGEGRAFWEYARIVRRARVTSADGAREGRRGAGCSTTP